MFNRYRFRAILFAALAFLPALLAACNNGGSSNY
jgi:hypothetical protein